MPHELETAKPKRQCSVDMNTLVAHARNGSAKKHHQGPKNAHKQKRIGISHIRVVFWQGELRLPAGPGTRCIAHCDLGAQKAHKLVIGISLPYWASL